MAKGNKGKKKGPTNTKKQYWGQPVGYNPRPGKIKGSQQKPQNIMFRNRKSG